MSDSAKNEYTLAMIKPNAVPHATEIEDLILSKDFQIVEKMKKQLTEDEARQFYEEHEGKPFYEGLIEFMISGEIIAMVLSKPNAISAWRELLGPTSVVKALEKEPQSIRALYGSKENDSHNAAHGSDSTQSAKRECLFFFPNLTLERVLTANANSNAMAFFTNSITPTLTQGLAELCKARPPEPAIWLADWLLVNNPQPV